MVGVMVATAPAGASGPKLKATPKSNLTNGSVVAVSGKGFTPGDNIYVVQCVTADQSLTGGGCNVAGAVGPETVSPKGTFGPVNLTMKTGQIGKDPGTCGTSKTDFAACSVSAGNATGGDSKQLTVKFKK